MLRVRELQKELSINVWVDDEIAGGDNWAEKIDAALQHSALGILVVTKNFLSSEFIFDRELPRLEERRKNSGLKLYPIVADPCDWQASPFLRTLQMNPHWRPNQCLPKDNWERTDDLSKIARNIWELLNEMPQDPATGETPAAEDPQPYSDTRRYAELEIGLYHHAFNVYQLEMRFGQLGDIDNNRLHRACIRLDLENMQGSPREIGFRLGELLFDSEETYEVLNHARAHAKRLSTSLGLRICIGANAQELCMIPWETLCDPRSEEFLAQTMDIRFSRFLLSDGIANFQTTTATHENELKSMVVPARVFTTPQMLGDAPSPHFSEDPSFAKERLSILTQDITAYEGEPVIEWVDASDGIGACDIMYITNSDFTAPDTSRWPTDSEGRCQSSCGAALVKELNRLRSLPRLIVLEPPFDTANECTSADIDYRALMENVVAAANQGVTGVLAPQGIIAVDSWRRFLNKFFEKLHERGDMARALSAARKKIRDHDDWWIPVLLSRRKSGYLKYRVGFESQQTSSKKWESLLDSIKRDQCLPILGPGMVQPYVGSRQYIAKVLSDRYYFPMAFQDRTNLRQVTQYLEVDYEDRGLMIRKIQEECAKHIRKIHAKQLESSSVDISELSLDDLIKEITRYHMQNDPLNPHRLLAEIPFKLYLTSNLAGVMTLALEEMTHRDPIELVYTPKKSNLRNRGKKVQYKLSRPRPLVYHLFGRLNENSDNITLTENDYFEFLINFSKEMNIARRLRRIPECVYGQLTSASLLFLGFNVREWDFHVIYRIWESLEGAEGNKRKPNVAVQIDPDDDYAIDPKRARKYLEDLFQGSSGAGTQVNIYWGTTRDFVVDLHERAKKEFATEMFTD
jgi:hypothetical protein